MSTPRSSAMRDKMRARFKATKAACGICGLPIDYTLPHTEPKSFVVDHIISLKRGGADALSNAQAAHRLRLQQHQTRQSHRTHRP